MGDGGQLLIPSFSKPAIAQDNNARTIRTRFLEGEGKEVQFHINDILRCKIVKQGNELTIFLYSEDGSLKQTSKSIEDVPEDLKAVFPEIADEVAELTDNTNQKDPNDPKSRAYKLALLLKHDPNGYDIVNRMSKPLIFDFFTKSFKYANAQKSALELGVHESLHMIDSDLGQNQENAFLLLGGQILRIPNYGTFDRSKVFDQLSDKEKSEIYAEIYLTGEMGAQGFPTLLEELNAYTHGANTMIALSDGMEEHGKIDKGMQTMMYYTQRYLEFARTSHPSVYTAIQENSDCVGAIESLWKQASLTLNKACASEYVTVDRDLINRIYQPQNLQEIEMLTEQQLSMPDSCKL